MASVNVELSDEERGSILSLIQVAWQTGSVKGEDAGVALSALRIKIQNSGLLKISDAQKPEAKPDSSKPEKKPVEPALPTLGNGNVKARKEEKKIG